MEIWWLIGILLGQQRSQVRIRHLPQWSWCAAGSLCNNVENLSVYVERKTYPWGKKIMNKNVLKFFLHLFFLMLSPGPGWRGARAQCWCRPPPWWCRWCGAWGRWWWSACCCPRTGTPTGTAAAAGSCCSTPTTPTALAQRHFYRSGPGSMSSFQQQSKHYN